jgi:hypothetical protein
MATDTTKIMIANTTRKMAITTAIALVELAAADRGALDQEQAQKQRDQKRATRRP